MSLKQKFITIRDNYVINQVKKIVFPEFTDDKVRRYSIVFKGRVQHVGFRLEVCELAKRLELTGFCQNLENGDVLVELQGPKEKIMFLVKFMESLVRIKIKKREVEPLKVDKEEKEFVKKA